MPRAYPPENGVISIVIRLSDGWRIEPAMTLVANADGSAAVGVLLTPPTGPTRSSNQPHALRLNFGRDTAIVPAAARARAAHQAKPAADPGTAGVNDWSAA